MFFLKSIILGLVQGLTEFLPVSSSAHLLIASKILGESTEQISFYVFLHLATLLAAAIYFRKEIWGILKSLGKIFSFEHPAKLFQNDPYFKLFCLLILGCIPTGLLGIFLKSFFESFFSSLKAVGGALIITGIFLWLTDFLRDRQKGIKEIGFWEALFVGLAQGIAIAPGISRSGATVAAALFAGMKKELAVHFSFLISIPAILGAALVELKDMNGFSMAQNFTSPSSWLGFFTALVSGYFAISFFIKQILKQRLRYFAWYCWCVGVTLLMVV